MDFPELFDVQVINEKIAWLEENADADADEMKAQKKEMEDIVQPIIAKLYQVWMMKISGLDLRIFKIFSSTLKQLFHLFLF